MENQFAILYLHSPKEYLFGKVLSFETSGVIFRGFPLDHLEAFKYQFKNNDPNVFFQTCFYPLYRVERMALDEKQGALPSVLEEILKTSRLSEEDIRKL